MSSHIYITVVTALFVPQMLREPIEQGGKGYCSALDVNLTPCTSVPNRVSNLHQENLTSVSVTLTWSSACSLAAHLTYL